MQAETCNTDTIQTQPHQITSTRRAENKATNVVIRVLLQNLSGETQSITKTLGSVASQWADTGTQDTLTRSASHPTAMNNSC